MTGGRPVGQPDAPDPPGAVRVRGLGVRFGGVAVLRDIDLDVAPGEWVTVIGPNGAGKSTLLRAVGGLLAAPGSVELFGTALGRLRRRERARVVATVAQSPVIPPGMSVLDYVLLGRTPYISTLGRESRADLAAVGDVLERLDLVRFADRPLQSLSGGERQRVFLARALAQGATLLLLDEPTSALDIGHQQEVLDLIDRLRGDGQLTVLATMHDLSLAGAYADRLVLLAAGRVVASGRPDQVLTTELIEQVYRVRVRVVDDPYGRLVFPVRQAPR